MQITQNITFKHSQEMILPFLENVVRFLESNLPEPNSALVFKAKVIATELLTNSIKHSSDGQTHITLALSADTFTMTKTDDGAPFTLSSTDLRWPLKQAIGESIKVYADSLNGLFVRVASANSLSFYTEDYDGDLDLLADLSEHYGLMIICRACNALTYTYNLDNGVNTFTATINL